MIPFDRLWSLLVPRHGELATARWLARLLGAVADKGEEVVADALRRALALDETSLPAWLGEPDAAPCVPVPQRLAGYEVETARAADYEALLSSGGVS